MAKVMIYTTPTCPYCKKAKEWLKEKKIKYKEVDVSTDEQARNYITTKSNSFNVPQFEINDKIIVGFDKEALEKELSA